MVRRLFGKVMWVGRATVFLVGLSVILALLFGVASTAFAHKADRGLFHLGHSNAGKALSTLVGTITTPVLKVDNNGTGPALQLEAGADGPPLVANADSGTATNLSADELDGKDSSEFANAAHAHSGADITSGTVAEARIDGAVARDSEVMPTVKANDGAGSGLDADMLDGQNSTAFVKQSEVKHAVVDFTGTIYAPASTPGTTASRSATGTYRVAFPNTNASQYTYAFGIEYNSFGFIRMDVPVTAANSITLYTADTSGTLADRSFDVIARCPSAGATSLAASSQSTQEASGVRAR